MIIKSLLTFDHELPLGSLNTSCEKALFEPTQKVMDLADKHEIKVTLFTDILCAQRYKDWDAANFYAPYKQQLQYAIKKGHDVQLHIHPHWLTSGYKNGTFLPSNDFALSNFKNDIQFGGIIRLSIRNLKEICTPIDNGYNCIAYRAGGYNI
jgi:hypothetical protein